jgi:hypothetical protein
LDSHASKEPIEILAWYEEHGRDHSTKSKVVKREGAVGQSKQGRRNEDRKIRVAETGPPSVCGDCRLTIDRSKEFTADAILFDNGPMHMWQMHGKFKGSDYYEKLFPDLQNRTRDQFWVFQNRESAIKCSAQASIISQEIDSAFNLTMTYRRDSDVTRRVSDIKHLITAARFEASSAELLKDDKTYMHDFMEQKFPYGFEHNTAWYVSNCNHTIGAENRFEYGKLLMDAGLRVHTEGACFGNVTQRKFGRNDVRDGYPVNRLKFYLAFENAFHCNDYISEKFWRNALGDGLVPIVYGPHPDDVQAVAPPNSYIHAEWFDHPDELVEYIDYLDKNDTAYLHYHEWRTLIPDQKKSHGHSIYDNIQGMGSDDRALCELCRKIRDMRHRGKTQSYKSVMRFWQYDVYPECKAAKQFQEYQVKIEENILQTTRMQYSHL